jgi:hypothetical protein
MYSKLFLAALVAPFFASAQDGSSFTEPNTGITFQVFEHSPAMKFGIVIPKTPGKDFIGFFVSIFPHMALFRDYSHIYSTDQVYHCRMETLKRLRGLELIWEVR